MAPFTGGDVLFGAGLTRPELIRRQENGARIITAPAGQPHAGGDLLFVIRQDGRLEPAPAGQRPGGQAGDTSVLLVPASDDKDAVPWRAEAHS